MTLQLHFPSTQKVVSTAASVASTVMLLRSLFQDYLPIELHFYLRSKLSHIFTTFSSEFTFIIDEFQGLTYNHLFNAAQLYLKPQIAPNTKRFKATMPSKENKIAVIMDRNEEIMDTFNGVVFKWRLISKQIPTKYIQTLGSDPYHSFTKSDIRYLELRFHKKHKDMVLEKYLPYVMDKAKEVRKERKTLRLFTLKSDGIRMRSGDMWQFVSLDHPATFETVVMDMEVKKMIMEDLDRFIGRKGFYKSIGKAWKRGYLLSGPPGTGKSSLIAAMANYLNFDVYDLELTDLKNNSDLRKLLIATANRSILVVEDIDCSLQLQDRLVKPPKARVTSRTYWTPEYPQVTLSGFLNFIDGLWSSCVDERIIVFTTNHKDKMDPALLRPGRMDVHIDMSYCKPCGVKMLASNYLGITEHPLFFQVEKLLETTNVTPAEVVEQFLKSGDPEIALRSLMELLIEKKQNQEPEHKAIQEDLPA